MKIGIVGTGNLGVHLSKLVCSNLTSANVLTISDINPYSASTLGKTLQRGSDNNNRVWVENNKDNVSTSDIIFITVKPDQVKNVCDQINRYSDGDMKTIISAAAGVPANKIRTWLTGEHNIIRFMPNIPISIGSGSIVWYIYDRFDAEHKIRNTLSDITSGPVSLWVSDEELIDAATVAFGCTPAYVAMYYNVYLNIAMDLGFNQLEAERLMKGTFNGTIRLIDLSKCEGGKRLIEQVASKGGATEKAMEILNEAGFQTLIEDSVYSSFKHIKNITKNLH